MRPQKPCLLLLHDAIIGLTADICGRPASTMILPKDRFRSRRNCDLEFAVSEHEIIATAFRVMRRHFCACSNTKSPSSSPSSFEKRRRSLLVARCQPESRVNSLQSRLREVCFSFCRADVLLGSPLYATCSQAQASEQPATQYVKLPPPSRRRLHCW